MKTDKELLILAAKAAGYVHLSEWSDCIGDYDSKHRGMPALHEKSSGGECNSFNALIDDGDALRLAVDLELDVTLQTNNKTATAWGYVAGVSIFSKSEDCGDDKHAATRRAIVRAAAAIGEAME